MAITVVAVGGSLGQHATSLAAVRTALEGACQAWAQVAFYDGKLDQSMYVAHRDHRHQEGKRTWRTQ
jgi:hypothetical protein